MLLNVFGQGSQTQNDWRATLRRKHKHFLRLLLVKHITNKYLNQQRTIILCY